MLQTFLLDLGILFQKLSFRIIVKESLPSELKIVEQLLLEKINALNSPLSALIHAQLPHCYPLVRAAVALTSSDHVRSIRQDKVTEGYSPSIYLAAALETLYLALKIHEVLINESSTSDEAPANKPQPSKALIGGTILAGDYCFSCSARLSAKTNNPLVVEVFARTLKKISEEHLAHLSHPESDVISYDTNRELFYTGIMASAALSHQPLEPYHAYAVQLSQQLTHLLQKRRTEERHTIDFKMIDLSDDEEKKWADFVVWLNQEKPAHL